MTAKQTLAKLRKLLEFKKEAAWTNLVYKEEIYGEDSTEANKARAIWSELLKITRLIDRPESIDELLVIWEDTND